MLMTPDMYRVEVVLEQGPQFLGPDMPDGVIVTAEKWSTLKAYIRSLRAVVDCSPSHRERVIAAHRERYGD